MYVRVFGFEFQMGMETERWIVRICVTATFVGIFLPALVSSVQHRHLHQNLAVCPPPQENIRHISWHSGVKFDVLEVFQTNAR